MSLSQTAPSPFAALLRRSKFVSYDPGIGQVYTSHGGHAFRGDWGFKRPLPNRRRTGFITVRRVDSTEQQTEWNSAESSARWIRRWEELGKVLKVSDMGPWNARITHDAWGFDTVFDEAGEAQASGAKTLHESDSVLNPEAMTPKQFQKYLEHLRALRPEFKQFLKDYWKNNQERFQKEGHRQLQSEKAQLLFTGSGDVQMLLSAQNAPEQLVSEFLSRKTTNQLRSLSSRQIEQRPHTPAGLEYTRMSALQSQYLHKPAPGRHIGANRPLRYEHGDVRERLYLLAVGGLVGSTPTTNNILPTDFGTRETPRIDRSSGKGLFRMSSAILDNAPQTVGRRPQRATDTKFNKIQFQLAQTSNLSNPHPLGSPEYVAHVDDVAAGADHHPIPSDIGILTRKVEVQIPKDYGKDTHDLVDRLTTMLPPVTAKGGQS